ncbi:GNAT family N-acetyltransferase [Oscillospiraceae bacterium PP1C4]
MLIETERLYLIPLTARQLSLLVTDIPALEQDLNCIYQGDAMEGFFLDIVKGQLDVTTTDSEHYLFHTFWQLMLKKERVIIGAADFKDVPNENGEVEIGYGIASSFQKQGYTTEAMCAMCQWALEQSGVRNVIAETDKENIASHRVLQKCGMQRYRETDDGYWWKLL